MPFSRQTSWQKLLQQCLSCLPEFIQLVLLLVKAKTTHYFKSIIFKTQILSCHLLYLKILHRHLITLSIKEKKKKSHPLKTPCLFFQVTFSSLNSTQTKLFLLRQTGKTFSSWAPRANTNVWQVLVCCLMVMLFCCPAGLFTHFRAFNFFMCLPLQLVCKLPKGQWLICLSIFLQLPQLPRRPLQLILPTVQYTITSVRLECFEGWQGLFCVFVFSLQNI